MSHYASHLNMLAVDSRVANPLTSWSLLWRIHALALPSWLETTRVFLRTMLNNTLAAPSKCLSFLALSLAIGAPRRARLVSLLGRGENESERNEGERILH